MIQDTPKKLYTGSVYRGILSLEGGRAPHFAAQLLSNFMTLPKEDFMTYSKTIFPTMEFDKLIFEFNKNLIETIDQRSEVPLGLTASLLEGYKLEHPATRGISLHRVVFSSGTQYYMVINYQKSTQGSMYDHSLNVWGELVKETVKAVSATGTPRTIAAPLVYLVDFMKTVNHTVDFHNQCYSRMAKTPEVTYTKEQVVSGMALDYVNITVTRK